MMNRSSPSSSSSSPVEFPTRGEITHSSHPEHPLTEITVQQGEIMFTCTGCKEHGAGRRFACRCDFQLHDFCALSPPVLDNHPLHPQHPHLLFHSNKPKSSSSRCDVCGKSTKGFNFMCSSRGCGFHMHPCCAMLSPDISLPSAHPHPLRLVLPGTATMLCGECRKKRPGRMYRCMSTTCASSSSSPYHVHAACVKSYINGLHDNGIPTPGDHKTTSALGTAARVASRVVIEFIGGFFEGLGEGVAQALVQNIVTARRLNTTRRRTTRQG